MSMTYIFLADRENSIEYAKRAELLIRELNDEKLVNFCRILIGKSYTEFIVNSDSSSAFLFLESALEFGIREK